MPSNLSENTILILSDEPMNIDVLTEALKDEYRLLETTVSRNGLERVCSEESVDLILLDILLPDQENLRICSRLQMDPNIRNIPVLILSAANQEKDILSGFAAGAIDYITKPYRLSILKARIHSQFAFIRAKEALLQNLQELERFSMIAIDREKRMIALKKEVNDLQDKLGQGKKYKIIEP